MDWRLMVSTLVAIFIAELGDKTQIAALTLTAESGKKLAVFCGASLALVLATALAVFFGGALSYLLPSHLLPRVAGVVFIGYGAAMLMRWI